MIDLRLLMPVAVNQVASRVVGLECGVLQNVVGKEGVESRRKARIDLAGIDWLWRGGERLGPGHKAEGLAGLRAERMIKPVGLIQRFGRGMCQTVGSRE